MKEDLFRLHMHSLIFTAMPDMDISVDEDELHSRIIKDRALFARYYTDSQLITPPSR